MCGFCALHHTCEVSFDMKLVRHEMKFDPHVRQHTSVACCDQDRFLPTPVPGAFRKRWILPRPKNTPPACFLNGLSNPTRPSEQNPTPNGMGFCSVSFRHYRYHPQDADSTAQLLQNLNISFAILESYASLCSTYFVSISTLASFAS